MASKKSKKKLFVLDTNVALHDSSCIYKFGRHDIVIPIQVIKELDNFKKGFDEINYHSREFCRILDELSKEHVFNGGVSLGQGLGKLRIILAKPLEEIIKKSFSPVNIDEEIINLALVLQKEHNTNQEVILVSKDTNLRLKAKALGVIAQDYLSEMVINTDFLSDEIKEIIVPQETIDAVYKKHEPVSLEIKGAKANQYFILKSEESTSTALVRYIHGGVKKILKESVGVFGVKPKNSEQAFMMDALLDKKISLVTVEGKAGTGKNFISLACALEQLKEKEYQSFFFTRQTVSMGDREIGFLPGDVNDKISPFMRGLDDNLAIIRTINGNQSYIKNFEQEERIIREPLAFIRGRSLKGVFFVIDEAQNLTPHEVKTIVTRAGEGTKIVFIGDTRQIDNPYLDQRSNGFSYLIEKFLGQECHAHVRLIKSERSPLAELAGDLL